MQAGLSLSGSAGVPLHETLTLPSHSLAAIAVAPAPFAPRDHDAARLAMLRSFLLNDCSAGTSQGLATGPKAFVNCRKQVYVFDDPRLKFTCLLPYLQPY